MPEGEQLFPDDIAAESEEDASGVSADGVGKSVVTGSDWTTETILSQLRRGNINLNPRFQRREVWSVAKKSAFIESILLNLPIPQIVLAERRDEPNTFIVLDGKQRLLALRQFASVPDLYPMDDQFEPLRLQGLTVRTTLNRRTYEDFVRTPELARDRNAFENHTIRTVVIRNWPDEDFLFRVFLRLNTGSVQLSPQELRQALKPGPFVDFVDEFALGSRAIRDALGNRGPDFRMRDTELLVRYFAFARFLENYRGNLKEFLDNTCDRLNARWADEEASIVQEAERCDRAIEATVHAFGEENAFTRPRGGRRFNRAVFDVMTYYFKHQELAEAAREFGETVREAFGTLCSSDNRFDQSISTTTKSIGNTAYRLVAWGLALSEATGTEIRIPGFLENMAADDAADDH